MSAYYPPGSMAGSGIDATTQLYEAECDHEHDDGTECGWHGTTDLDINDHGTAGVWECPRCGTLHDAEPVDPREYE